MTPERRQQIRALFDAALEQPSAGVEEFLRRACGGDTQLYSEVCRMLEEHRQTEVLNREPPAAAPGAPVFRDGQMVAGRYRIVRFVNRGGMGEVYEAQDLELREAVALKTLLPAIAEDESMIARFKQEIALSRKIGHPNVCRVFDLDGDESDGGTIIFLTMEFLGGETLAARLQRDGAIALPEALRILEQMGAALDAAHNAGVIHRDLKPSNVMLVPSAVGVRAVVTDFGLARSFAGSDGSTSSISTKVVGTLNYMAPELLAGSVATFGSDVYALGMVAYKMVTGALPFAADTPLAGAILRAKKPIPSPRVRVPGLDEKWEHAILRALDVNPAKRFTQASHFLEALRGETVSMTVKLPVITRRRAVAAGFTVLAIVAAAVGWRELRKASGRLSPEAQTLYQKGVDDIAAGAYFAATKALGEVAQLAPRFTPAGARLAESWLELDLPEKAGNEMLVVRRQDNSGLPKLDQLQIEAVDRTITREFAAAVDRYERMLALSGPDPARVNVDLGRAYEKAGKPDKAVEAYRRAAEGPSHSPAAWLRLGVLYGQRAQAVKSDEAFAQADRLYRLTSNLEGLTEVALQRGIAANRGGQLSDAATFLQTAIERAHDAGNLQQEISARLALATNAYMAGDAERAEAYAQESLASAQAGQMEALTIRGLVNLGNAYFRKSEYESAEKHLREALALARRTNSARLAALAQLSLASLHDRLQKSDEQFQEARDALSYYEPNGWVQQTVQGLALMGRADLDRGNVASAMDTFHRLSALAEKTHSRSNMAIAAESLGNGLFAEEKYPQALEQYQQFLGLAQGERVGYARLECGLTLLCLGRYPESREMLDQADEVAVKFPPLRRSIARYRAETLLSQNQFANAVELAQRTLADGKGLNPVTAADLERLLGLAWLRSGKRDAGMRKCREALDSAIGLKDPGSVLDARMAALEAWIAVRDPTRAATTFHDLEPTLDTHPESRWRALALMAILDNAYTARAKDAIDKLAESWGNAAFQQYLTRKDVHSLAWPILHPNFARH